MIQNKGRIGKPTEFVEFALDNPKLTVVAQKSINVWLIYLVWPHVEGAVRTIGNPYLYKHNAINAAKIIAEALEKYGEVTS